jgi:hypothetical protein
MFLVSQLGILGSEVSIGDRRKQNILHVVAGVLPRQVGSCTIAAENDDVIKY